MIRAILLLVVPVVLFVAAPARAMDVQRVVSPGGIEAWLVEDHTNPMLAVRFAFRGGSALDPAGKEGLADMVSTLLDEGAGDLDSQAFQRRLESLAVTLRFDAGLDSFGGRMRTLTRNRDDAFDLLRMAVTKPRFDAEPIERMRAQLLANLRVKSEDPGTIASRALFKALFPNDPYGRPSEGTEATIAKITVDDLRGFVARRLARDNLVVGVVGDISPVDLSALLDRTFGALPAHATDWRQSPVTPAAPKGVEVIAKTVPQSNIVFAQRGLMRDDPDFYTAYVLNHILGGGGFTSRLYDSIREKRGLAYSVYSALYPLDRAGLIIGGAGTANASAGGNALPGARRMEADGRKRADGRRARRCQALPDRVVPAALLLERRHRRHAGRPAARPSRDRLPGSAQRPDRGGQPGRYPARRQAPAGARCVGLRRGRRTRGPAQDLIVRAPRHDQHHGASGRKRSQWNFGDDVAVGLDRFAGPALDGDPEAGHHLDVGQAVESSEQQPEAVAEKP